MNYFLYGADTYRSRRKLREIIDAYRQRAGATFNLHRFDAEDDDLARLQTFVGGQSLFGGAKKLIVIERPFASPRQFCFVRDALENLRGSTETLVMLWDGAIAQEAKKMLAEIEPLVQKTQEFKPLQGPALTRWIKQEADALRIDLVPADIAGLASFGKGDLWGLHNEMEKMAVSERQGSRMRGEGRGKEATVFQLGDAFFSSPKDALGTLLSLFAQGEDEMRIFSYLAGHSRTLMLVKSYLDARRPIDPSHKIHPFVIKKATVAVRMLTSDQLVRRLSLFLEEDIKIKTGLVRPKDALLQMLTSRMSAR